MIFTTNDKGKILLLAFLVVVLISFVFQQWLNFLPLQKIGRVGKDDSAWQVFGPKTSIIIDSIKDSVDQGALRLGLLEDEFQRQSDQDAVVSAFKDRIGGQATSTSHMCNKESDCSESGSCLVDLSDDEEERLGSGETLNHFGRPTFCESRDNLLGCLFYAMEDGEILEICVD